MEVTLLNETISSSAIASGHEAKKLDPGIFINDEMLASLCKHNVARFPYEISGLNPLEATNSMNAQARPEFSEAQARAASDENIGVAILAYYVSMPTVIENMIMTTTPDTISDMPMIAGMSSF